MNGNLSSFGQDNLPPDPRLVVSVTEGVQDVAVTYNGAAPHASPPTPPIQLHPGAVTVIQINPLEGEPRIFINKDLARRLFKKSDTEWEFNEQSLGSIAEGSWAKDEGKVQKLTQALSQEIYGAGTVEKDASGMFVEIWGKAVPELSGDDALSDAEKLVLITQSLYFDSSVHNIAEKAADGFDEMLEELTAVAIPLPPAGDAPDAKPQSSETTSDEKPVSEGDKS